MQKAQENVYFVTNFLAMFVIRKITLASNMIFVNVRRRKKPTKFWRIILSYEATAIRLPLEGTKNKFQHWFKTLTCPLVIYADTEALCHKNRDDVTKTENTTRLEEQKLCLFGTVC